MRYTTLSFEVVLGLSYMQQIAPWPYNSLPEAELVVNPRRKTYFVLCPFHAVTRPT